MSKETKESSDVERTQWMLCGKVAHGFRGGVPVCGKAGLVAAEELLPPREGRSTWRTKAGVKIFKADFCDACLKGVVDLWCKAA